MSDWAVADFVSRVAERVSTAGESLAAQLIDPYLGEFDVDGLALLSTAFPYVEPPTDFVRILRQSLLEAPRLVQVDATRSIANARRVVYGVAAVGSIASAAVVAMFFLRYRAANRPAA